MNFTAPYRFVPLNKHVFIPHFVEGYPENISQDVPFKYGKDGSIEVEFTNITPILVAGDEKNGNLKEPQVIRKAGKEFFVIPGSSWKGMIRSVMEIMSFAKMQPYDNATFGYRNVGGKNDSDYNQKMQAALCGWLYKEGSLYYLLPCGGIEKISKDEISNYKSIEGKNIIEKLEYFNQDKRNDKDWKYPELNGKVLVFTGPIRKKEHEYLFPKPESIKSQRICLGEKEKVIKNFFSVYRNSPYNDEKGKRFIETWLDNGKKLPVFYLKSNGEITDMGITRMFRLPYKHSISDFVRQKKVEGRDLVECIFGYTDTQNKSSLKGRVQFGHTLVPKDCDLLKPIGGVLGEPKASFFPFYLKQQGIEPQTYDSDDAEIAGRKRYPIHENNSVSELPKGNGNEKTISKLMFVPAGRSLKLTIHFHNLLPVELGALLSAITFHGCKQCYYNIGMAKGYGYGKLELKDCTVKIDGEKVKKDEFLSSFEAKMKEFVKNWAQSEQIQALFGIASGTIPEVNLKTMEMEKKVNGEKKINEFENCRDFKNYSGGRKLMDWKVPEVNDFAQDDKFFQTLDCCAQTYINKKDFEEAKRQYSQILEHCRQEKWKQFARDRIASVEKIQEQIALEFECTQNFVRDEKIEEAIKHYRIYHELSGKSIPELDQMVLDEADQLKKSCKYAEAIEKYREYEQLTGLSKAQDILYCEKCLEELSKSIAERLTYHASVAAFVNSLKKALAGRQLLTDDEMKEIGCNMAENVKAKDKIKWQNSASQFKGILSDEQVAELLNYIK